MLMPGIRAARLPGMEPFPGAGGITKGFSAVLPLPAQPGQLLAAGQCSGSQCQEQEQLEQALASLLGMSLQVLPCALTPLGALGLGGPGAWTVPVPLWHGSPHQSVLAEDGLSLTTGLNGVKAQKKSSGFCF